MPLPADVVVAVVMVVGVVMVTRVVLPLELVGAAPPKFSSMQNAKSLMSLQDGPTIGF
jgi:type III secretory pathway component EscU